jgi:oligoribonuclease
MKQKKSELMVWMDLEMTGLDPLTDKIIEIATLITDKELNIVAQGPELIINQPETILQAMDSWNKEHHGASGLIEKVQKSTISIGMAEKETLNFIKKYVDERTAPLCGNSIWQDRRFISGQMPGLDTWLHYRNIDVSTIKELARRWYPDLLSFKKQKQHTALADIKESIAELKYYKKKIFINSSQLI